MISDDLKALVITAIKHGLSNEQIAAKYEDVTVGQIKAVRAHVTMDTHDKPLEAPQPVCNPVQVENSATPVPSLLEQVEASWKNAGPNTAYAEYLAKNRPHQVQSLEVLAKSLKGQVIIPTGTGKTRVQVAHLVGDMIAKGNMRGVYVIASHRLLLNKQLMDEFQDLCIKCGLPVNVLYVGSSRIDDKEVYEQYFQYNITSQTFSTEYTTSSEDIKKYAEKTATQGRHLIIVSTYHSFDRLNVLDAIDVCCYDEAHNTVEVDFSANIKLVYPKIARNYFFTATRKTCVINGHGMENEAIYGNLLYEVSPREMIDVGEIVRPKIISMMLDNENPKGVVSDKNQHMLVKTVIEAFERHKEAVKANSCDPSKIGAKLLVSCLGSDELALVQESDEFKNWCKAHDVKVFSFSTRYGAYEDFQASVNRSKVYEQMRALKDEEDAILLHIDILAEGIDLPSITGVLLLRHLNEVKLFQTLGRALRLMGMDRDALYKGSISVTDKTKWIKPYAYLILPLHFEKMDVSSEDMKGTIQKVISTYGIPVEEFLPSEEFKARDLQMLDPVTDVRKISKMKKDFPLLSVIEDFVIDEFTKDLPTDPKEKYEALLKMFQEKGEDDA